MYALAASRHMHEYGTTREQLAEVAVAARRWAKLNPEAFMRDDLTVEDVLSSRMVSSPLSVRDCCLVTDGGGGAAILTGAERARDLRKPPVYLLGAGGGALAPQHKPDTSGGGLSYNHPGMYGLLLIVEAVRQLRAEGGRSRARTSPSYTETAACSPARSPLCSARRTPSKNGAGAAGSARSYVCINGGFGPSVVPGSEGRRGRIPL